MRETYEYDIMNISGKHIPLSEIMNSVDQIAKDIPVIIHCRSGKRSASVIEFLESKYQMENLYNLKGGILAYAHEIDNSLPTY